MEPKNICDGGAGVEVVAVGLAVFPKMFCDGAFVLVAGAAGFVNKFGTEAPAGCVLDVAAPEG